MMTFQGGTPHLEKNSVARGRRRAEHAMLFRNKNLKPDAFIAHAFQGMTHGCARGERA
jgi:hypothetical protein